MPLALSRITTLLFMAGLTATSLTPLAALADPSKCASRIKAQAQGFFITDIDSDLGRPYGKCSVINNSK